MSSGVKSIGFSKEKLYITLFHDEHYCCGYLMPYSESTFCYDLSGMNTKEIEQMKKDMISL